MLQRHRDGLASAVRRSIAVDGAVALPVPPSQHAVLIANQETTGVGPERLVLRVDDAAFGADALHGRLGGAVHGPVLGQPRQILGPHHLLEAGGCLGQVPIATDVLDRVRGEPGDLHAPVHASVVRKEVVHARHGRGHRPQPVENLCLGTRGSAASVEHALAAPVRDVDADLAASSWPQGCSAAMAGRLTQMLTQLENYRSGRFPTVSEPGSFAALASLGTAVTGSSCPSGGAQHGDRLHDRCARRGWPIGHDRCARRSRARGDRHRSARRTGGSRLAGVRQAAGRDRSPASRSRQPARHCRRAALSTLHPGGQRSRRRCGRYAVRRARHVSFRILCRGLFQCGMPEGLPNSLKEQVGGLPLRRASRR